MKNKNTLYDVKITRFIISKRKNSSNFLQKNLTTKKKVNFHYFKKKNNF